MILLDPLACPVIAHRGASGTFPENTLLAFTKALEMGVDAVEFDVRLTRDRVAVVIHDDTVDRTTDGSGAVRDMVLDELADLDAGSGERIATLASVLDSIGEIPAIIEAKEVEASQLIVQAVAARGAKDRVLVGSFLDEALTAPRQAGIKTSAGRGETARWWAASRIGWPKWQPVYGAFTIPEYSGRLKVVDRRFVKFARQKQLPVHVWTVDNRAKAEHLRSLGVGGIITNFPERMKDLPRLPIS
ncbi:MAG: glycerophosphodiester phosphodiesterase family protein [Gemmatimonadota bacterium]|nr:glycerophosphodiester phosphodiesterase family protein [Gemmatimonadota bacterium]